MQVLEEFDDDAELFWSDMYRGRTIAIFCRDAGWHVYLDHVLQHKVIFETAHEAVIWLMHRVDQGIPGRLN